MENSRDRMEPLLEEYETRNYVAMEDIEESVEGEAIPGPLGQTAAILQTFRITIVVIILVLAALFVAYSVVNTSSVHGLGLNNGQHSCVCDPGWKNTNSTSVCNQPVEVDRGTNTKGCDGCNGHGTCQMDHGPLNWKSYTTIGITFVALILMVNDAPPDLAMLGATIALLLTGIIGPDAAWSGFSQPGVLSVGVLFAVAEGVQEAGAVDVVLRAMLGQPSTLPVALLRLLLPVACISAFMNNTPVVAMLIPVIDGWSKRIGFHKSHFLMPLSFASMLGGCCTLLGTSTNLVANAVLNSPEYKHETLTMFELAPIGVPLTIAGSLYMAFASGWLLVPAENPQPEEGGSATLASSYTIAFIVSKDSIVAGESVERSGIGRMEDCELKELTKANGDLITAPDAIAECILEPEVVVLFHASAQGIVKLRRLRGLLPLSKETQSTIDLNDTRDQFEVNADNPMPRNSSSMSGNVSHVALLGRKRRHRRLYEAVLDRGSPLCDTVVDDAQIREVYEAAVLSVRRGGEAGTAQASSTPRPRQNSASSPRHNRSRTDTVESLVGLATLQPGDTLLLEANPNFQRVFSKTNHFALVREVEGSKPPRHDEGMDQVRMWLSLTILIAMVAVAATGTIDLLPAALITVGVLVASKCISLDEAFRAIKGRVLLAIVVTFGVSTAMKSSGVAAFVAEGIVALCTPMGPRGLIGAIFLVGACVGCVVSNNATVILMLPICFSVAQKVDGVSFKQLVVTLLMAASASFLTPISYQTNLMVYGPGGYAFTSFTKFGAPLVIIMMALCVILIPIVYP